MNDVLDMVVDVAHAADKHRIHARMLAGGYGTEQDAALDRAARQMLELRFLQLQGRAQIVYDHASGDGLNAAIKEGLEAQFQSYRDEIRVINEADDFSHSRLHTRPDEMDFNRWLPGPGRGYDDQMARVIKNPDADTQSSNRSFIADDIRTAGPREADRLQSRVRNAPIAASAADHPAAQRAAVVEQILDLQESLDRCSRGDRG